jgi:predicted RNA-binding Zn ribbon-like protein
MKTQHAPGALELVRVFVNSIDLERPESDALAEPRTAEQWAEREKIAVGIIASGELEALRELRESIRNELRAHTEGAGGAGLPALFGQLRDVELKLAVDAEGSPRLEPVASGSAARMLRGSLAAALYDAVRTGSWSRLKACRKQSCLFAFYDHSKNGSGAWCNMDVCGNRAKAQRRRVRDRRRGA